MAEEAFSAQDNLRCNCGASVQLVAVMVAVLVAVMVAVMAAINCQFCSPSLEPSRQPWLPREMQQRVICVAVEDRAGVTRVQCCNVQCAV